MAGIGVTRVADCPVCFGTFKDPRVLPCGHTFCLGCITEHGRSKGSDPDCPNCRTKFQIPSNGFDTLPKNYSLNSVLGENSSIGGASKETVTKGSTCKKHNGKELVLYCVQCSVVICLNCMDYDHRKHDCCSISTFAEGVQTQLDGYLKSITPILSEVRSQKTQLQEKSKKFLSLLGATESAINEECEKNKQLLDDHRRLLLEELSNEKHKVTKGLKMKTVELETEELTLASFNTRIEEMLQGTDEAKAFDMVVQFKDLKDSFEKLKQMQPQTVGQVSITGIEFIPSDFRALISRRGNAIGRLQKESHSRKDLTPGTKQVDLSQAERVPIEQDVGYYLERFEPRCTCVIKSSDQYDMEEQMSVMEPFDVRVIVKDNQTVELEGSWVNIVKAIEQLKDLQGKKLAGKSAAEETKEQTSDKGDATMPGGRKRNLLKDLTPSTKQVDVSQAERVPIEQDVWYYLERKHPNKVNDIAKKHLCISRVVCGSSNEGMTHCLEIVPCYQDNSEAAKKYVEDAVEEFAQLYQKVSELGIVREAVKLPLELNKDMPPKLTSELEEVDVFFLGGDNPCLVGTKDCIEEAKRKLSDFARRQNISPAQMQPKDDSSLAHASAADPIGPMKFKTPQGLTVHVSKGDLVRQSVDVIVNPANENLGNGGGAARTIADAAGYELKRECKEYIQRNGKLGITCVTHTSAGNLRPKIKNGSSSPNMNNGLSHSSSADSYEVLEKAEAADFQPEKASGAAGKKAAKADDDKKTNDNKMDDDDDNHCSICMDDITDKKELSCKHKFCRECIDEYFSKGQPKCPSCGKVFGTLRGDQPRGTMKWKERNWQHLPGYNGCGTIEIEYYFPDGKQGENHPNPGQSYRGTHRTAYLPANKDGKEVLCLLRRAFDADLVFTIGRSNTTGRENYVIWNDVHHKTSTNGQSVYFSTSRIALV